MHTRLDDLLYFVTLVDQGSMSKAAKYLKVPKSRVSRHLSELEQSVGNTLLRRTTRKQSLTESGLLLYRASKPHIDALSKVEEEVSGLVNEPKGELNILLPLEFFNQIMSVLLAEFALLYPKICLHCAHYSQPEPSPTEQFDITFVLHEGPLPASNWIAKSLLSFPQSIYAPPNWDCSSYKVPQDLAEVASVSAHKDDVWFFRQGSQLQAVPVTPRVIFSSPEMRRQAVQRGLGLAKLPNYTCQLNCQMQKIELTSAPIAQELSVLYQSRDIPLKTRIFLDFFQDNIGRLEID
ncbi:LysR family transcriptional regulator [Gayadomonas joobiniege]|uniref:LysR family transcriptional regulator n=1 Tax=Gayadomonas joobiniege TaxID=1234606 RepID=UPI000380DAB5|nr:LysR family transcriptional regulator [Gayadomonas joobiniege]